VKLSVFLPFCYALTNDASAELYHRYWIMLSEQWGDRELDEMTPGDIKMVAKAARRTAVTRSNSQNGLYAEQHLVAAARKLFALAMAEGHCSRNPAQLVEMPKRPRSPRHAITHQQVTELFESCERDEDTVTLRFMVETGCRREGLVNLQRKDLRPARQTVWLDEKNSARREQPVSQALMLALMSQDCHLYGITRRRLDGLWVRVKRNLPWAQDLGISSHWLRHYAITSIEAVSGYATAAAFAGHTLGGGNATSTYVHKSINDVAGAWSRLWGEPHPLAPARPTSAGERVDRLSA